MTFASNLLTVTSAWLKDYESDVIRRINRRVEAITGLTENTAEILQVMCEDGARMECRNRMQHERSDPTAGTEVRSDQSRSEQSRAEQSRVENS